MKATKRLQQSPPTQALFNQVVQSIHVDKYQQSSYFLWVWFEEEPFSERQVKFFQFKSMPSCYFNKQPLKLINPVTVSENLKSLSSSVTSKSTES